MGRHRKKATRNNGVQNQDTTDEAFLTDVVDERLGLKDGLICYDCNANNPSNASKCRKCGGNLRQKKSQFQDNG